MTTNDILLLGLKNSVSAISKSNGCVMWSTELGGGMGTGFVTVLSDGKSVFAYSHGQLHCLELASGRLLWTNKLRGFGYGLASLSLPGGASAPEISIVQQIFDDQAAASAASSSTTTS